MANASVLHTRTSGQRTALSLLLVSALQEEHDERSATITQALASLAGPWHSKMELACWSFTAVLLAWAANTSAVTCKSIRTIFYLSLLDLSKTQALWLDSTVNQIIIKCNGKDIKLGWSQGWSKYCWCRHDFYFYRKKKKKLQQCTLLQGMAINGGFPRLRSDDTKFLDRSAIFLYLDIHTWSCQPTATSYSSGQLRLVNWFLTQKASEQNITDHHWPSL